MENKGEDQTLEKVLHTLSLLAPAEIEAPLPATVALAQLKRRVAQSSTGGSTRSGFFNKEFNEMFNKRKFAFSAVLVLLMVVAFAMPGVRAAASDFLGLFRVQKFAPISISPQQLALLEDLAEQGLTPGELKMIDEPSEPKQIFSLTAAERALGQAVANPRLLPVADVLYLSDSGRGQLTINAAGSRAILEATGVDPEFVPLSLDGAVVDVTVYPSVVQEWKQGIVLLQTPSPQVNYPSGLNPAPLGEAMLQVLGMSPEEAARLSQSIDWTSTLVLPIPQSAASFEEVRIGGVSGLALSSLNGNETAIIWQESGMVYVLSGNITVRELTRLARSVE